MKRKHRKQWISILLSIMILFTGIVIPSTATSKQNGQIISSTGDAILNNTIAHTQMEASVAENNLVVADPDAISDGYELIDRREENVKHFRKADGTIDAIVYGYAVHSKDKEGKWQDIDNRLFKSAADATEYTTHNDRVTFAAKASDSCIFSIAENGYRIAMGLTSNVVVNRDSYTKVVNNASVAKIYNHVPREEQVVKLSTLKNQDACVEQLKVIDNTTRVVYADVYTGVDLKYTLESNEIKEHIIVNSPQDEYIYSFSINVTGLVAKLLDNGGVYLYDALTLEEKYRIPVPFMFDANHEVSNDVSYELTNVNEGVYILTVIADSTWINDDSRAFPVTIDPSIYQSLAFYDTYIDALAPAVNNGTDDQLWVSANRITYINSSLNGIPKYAVVNVAWLYVAYYYYSYITDGYVTVGVYEMTAPWYEDEITWNSANQNSNMGLSTTRAASGSLLGSNGAYVDSPKWSQFLITSLAQAWIDGAPRNGLAIKYEGGPKASVILCSREFGTDYRPYFAVNYNDPLESGVYLVYSQHFGSSTPKIMDTTGGGTFAFDGTEIQTMSIETSKLVGTRSERAQLYKITRLSSNGYYTIRPMSNSALGLAPSGTGVTAQDGIGVYDESNISSAYFWKIINKVQDVYTFQNVSTGKYLSISTNSADGANVQFIADQGNSRAKWKVIKFAGDTSKMRGAELLFHTSHIVQSGNSLYLGNIADNYVFYSNVLWENHVPVSVSVTNYDGTASPIAYISGNTLYSYPNKFGLVCVRFQFGAGSNAFAQYVSVYFQPPDNTHCYIQNVRLSNGLQYGFIQPAPINSQVKKSTITFNPDQAWQLIRHGSTNYYLIKNVSTNQYLTSPATTAVDTDVSMSSLLPYISVGNSSQPNPRQLWVIADAPSGSGGKTLKSKYMVDSGENLCLAVNSSNNVLLQGDYVNNTSYLDEFNVLFFGEDVVFQRSHYYDNRDFDEDRFNETLDYISRQYDDMMLIHKTVPLTYDKAISLAENSKITVFCGHADATSFAISYYRNPTTRASSTLKEGILYNTDLYKNGVAQADLSNVDLIIFAGCEAAKEVSSGYNLAQSANLAEARVSIGWELPTTSELFEWMKFFFQALNNGETVSEAQKFANGKMPTGSASCSSVIYGDKNYKFS